MALLALYIGIPIAVVIFLFSIYTVASPRCSRCIRGVGVGQWMMECIRGQAYSIRCASCRSRRAGNAVPIYRPEDDHRKL